MTVTARYSVTEERPVCTTAFWMLLAWDGETELLAASIVFLTRVEAHLVCRCGLDVRVKHGDVHHSVEIVSNDLETLDMMNLL